MMKRIGTLICLTMILLTYYFIVGCSEDSTGPDQTQPQVEPHAPFPEDGATVEDTTLTLSWQSSAPDGDTLTYDIYFDTVSPPSLVSSGQMNTTYNPGPLEWGTTYYWKIVAKDESAQLTSGPIWNFTPEAGSTQSGVFAALVVGRSITWFDPVLFRMDVITARFDSAYAPCSTIKPLHPSAVSCDQYTLEWEDATKQYTYSQTVPTMDFLVPGDTYSFEVDAGVGVPSLSKSIDFPSCEPYITNPANNADISITGFTATWEGSSCGGQVRFVIIGQSGDTTGVDILTENDGSYTFTQQELSVITAPQANCSLILIFQNSDSIVVSGYDSRSFIWARVINTSIINFID